MLITRKFKLILLLIVVTFFAYFSSLGNPFIWDDEQFITRNVYVQSFDIGKIFTQNTIAGAGQISNYYRPLTTLSFAIDKSLWGQNPFGFHITNLTLHICAGIVLFLLLTELGMWNLAAFFVSLFFLIFPTQTEAVSYINSRGDSMFTFFLFGSLFLFTKGLSTQKKWLYLSSILLFILSIFSKETAIAAFPLFFVLIFMKILNDKKSISQSIQFYKKGIIVGLFSALIVGFYFFLRLTVLNFGNVLNYYADQTVYSTHFFIRLFTFARVLWTYLSILVWPYPLHMERSVSLVYSFFTWEVLGILLLIASILYLAFWEIRKNQTAVILFGFSMSACLLFPVSGIIPINGILYEHWLYVPMVGFWIMVYGALSLVSYPKFISGSKMLKRVLHDKKELWRKFLIAFVIFLAILYTVLTIKQNNIWADPETFYRYTLSFALSSARLHNNLGISLADKGNMKGAIIEYKKALGLGSDYPQIYNNLGNAEMVEGDYKDAEKNLKKALKLAPNFGVAKQNLIKLYLLTGKYEKAQSLSDNDPQIERIIKQLQSQR